MKKWLSFAAIAVLTTVSFTGCEEKDGSQIADDTTQSVALSIRYATDTTDAAIASTCANGVGGVAIYTGFDKNSNGILDTNEYESSTPKIICNGAAGSAGVNGVDGVSSVAYNKYINDISTSKVQFEEVEVPTTTTEQANPQTSPMVTINGDTQIIKFTKLLATGETNNGETFGAVKDYQDQPIKFSDNSSYVCNGTNGGVGSGLDYTSILQKNNKLYMVSQFECQIGAMYMAELEQERSTGELSVKANSLKYVSQKEGFGGFVHCAGQKTPWESHLGSEEYETNAKSVESTASATTGLTGDTYYDETAKYWGDNATLMSPYYYGWTPEVTISDNGTAVYQKHYSMGRMSHELSYVMPDRKTVYMSDDGTNVGLYMYIANTPADLSEGTIYAAKWIQKDAANGGYADISWIKLGSAKDSDIKTILDADNNVNTNDAPKFSDIFASVDPSSDGTCASGYKSINTSAGHECLSLKSGKETAAAFLETRRYAAYLGATTEFRKEEGITFDPEHNKLFVAMSAIAYGMEDNKKKGSTNTTYDIGANNDIKLNYNPCGGVYALDIKENLPLDMAGDEIKSSYVVGNMYAILTGEPTTYPTGHPYASNTCSVNGIANPDNVTYLAGSNILTIGEDTSSHVNNMIWAYDLSNGKLTRTFTTPTKAETTSPFWYKNINGYGYMTAVTQHPIKDSNSTNYLSTEESFVGVVGPFDFTKLDKKFMSKIATYKSVGKTDGTAGSEIVAYDSDNKKMFITNGANNRIDIATINTSGNLTIESSVDMSSYGASIQSAAYNATTDKLAVAVGSSNKTATKGSVVIMNSTGTVSANVTVGYLPDMVTFTADGSKILVANEGEPDASNGTYVDVIGSVGVITVSNSSYVDIDFAGVTLSNATDGTVVRLGGTPSNNATLDIEPEYITVDPNNANYAYVTLQENNAIAKIDLSNNTLVYVKSLGAKDHSLTKNAIDIEEDGKVEFKTFKNLYGMYQPDSIASYNVGGTTYLVTANEGDGREYLDSNSDDVFVDEKKISKLTLDSSISSYYADDNDLKVMIDLGNSSSTYSKLYTYGGRSFSIWDANGDLVWDSANNLSILAYQNEPTLFNHDDFEKDGRSGNKGVEPEALTIGTINSKTYAFVGLERQSAIVIYDITTPTAPTFVEYIKTHEEGDISPEGMKFVDAANSPTGNPLLIVAYEVSSTTVVYEIK